MGVFRGDIANLKGAVTYLLETIQNLYEFSKEIFTSFGLKGLQNHQRSKLKDQKFSSRKRGNGTFGIFELAKHSLPPRVILIV